MTHLELKEFILNNLSDCVGTYTTETGDTFPAISLLPHPTTGYYFPPDSWQVTGIEFVIIKPNRDDMNTRQLIGDVLYSDNWKIGLKQHDQLGSLQDATEAAFSAFSVKYPVKMGAFIPPSKELGIIASSSFSVFDHRVLIPILGD